MRQNKSNKPNGRKLHRKKAAGLLFVVMLALIFVINLVWKDQEFSEKENRMLEQKPELTLSGIESGRFMKQYESYKSDQFAGRNFWVELKTRVDLLMGKRESGGVYKGKKKYLLEDIAKPNEEQMQKNLEAMVEFQKQNLDTPMYMMLVPNAANVLEHRLPNFAVTEDQNQQFKEIKKALGDQIVWVDAYKALNAHQDENIYYHTDHHWTTLGAYYAYQALAETMKLDTGKAPKLTPVAVTNSFNGTLSANSGYETGYEEPIYIYVPEEGENSPEIVVNYVDEKEKTGTLYDSSKLKEKDKYAMFLSGNHAMVNIRTTADTTDRLLLIKDSYANCLVPFLTPYYREIIVIDPRYYYGDIREVMSKNKISSVLFLYNGNTFVTDNSISGVLQNGETE